MHSDFCLRKTPIPASGEAVSPPPTFAPGRPDQRSGNRSSSDQYIFGEANLVSLSTLKHRSVAELPSGISAKRIVRARFDGTSAASLEVLTSLKR